jgi:tRNA threonylcarbamoyladenosine biosynthesis protein TsaB
VVFTRCFASGITHNEVILPLLKELFDEAGLAPADLAAIGVTIGPGMFTSLRVGLSAAKGLAVAHGIPVKGIGTLPGLAASVTPARTVLALVDARKSEVYAALYDGSSEALAPCVVSPSALPDILRSTISDSRFPIALAGSGTHLCLDALNSAGITAEDSDVRYPSAAAVARLADERIQSEGRDDTSRLEPLYLRRTDAELNRERRAETRQ